MTEQECLALPKDAIVLYEQNELMSAGHIKKYGYHVCTFVADLHLGSCTPHEWPVTQWKFYRVISKEEYILWRLGQ